MGLAHTFATTLRIGRNRLLNINGCLLIRLIECSHIMRKPDAVPSGCTQPIKISQPNWLLWLISLAFFVVAMIVVALISSGTLARLAVDPQIIWGFDTREIWYHVGLLLIVSLVTFEAHEQLHRLSAKGLGLEPVYRRSDGYVVIQETWISRRKLNLMTAAPILVIQLSALLIFIFASGMLENIAEITFVLNATLIAKDVSDIAFHFRLPHDTQFWMSDLGEEPVTYFSAPYQNVD